MAFLLERTLELKLKSRGVEYSPQKIREALSSLEFSQIELEGQTFYLRSAVEGLANELLRANSAPFKHSRKFLKSGRENDFFLKFHFSPSNKDFSLFNCQSQDTRRQFFLFPS